MNEDVRVIAFATRGDSAEADRWLSALRAALPEARIEPVAALDEADRHRVRVAIVADPDPAVLGTLPNLVWVQSLWAGVERLVQELGDTGVGIVRLIDPRLAETMAEAVLTWTLWLHRDGPRYARQQRERRWLAHPSPRPAERTVGVLGLGELGTASATRLVANGFDVRAWSRRPRRSEEVPAGVHAFHGEAGLGDVLGASDIVVVLLPLTDATRGLLDGERLARVKPGAALVNFARGAIVDIDALRERLDEGALGHAVLDVFAVEPLPEDDPLWSRADVTVLPHVSGPTDLATAAAVAAGNVRRYSTSGQVPVIVDLSRGY